MKKILSLFISYIMLFNLTAPVFAAPRLVSKEQAHEINSTLTNAYNNNSTTSNYNAAYYEKNYQNSLKELASVSDKYQDIVDVINKASQIEMLEASDLEILNDELLKAEKDIIKYNNTLETQEKRIEKLGGMDKIEQRYVLYQNWLALKPDMEKLRAEQENIVRENKEKLNQKDISRKEKEQAKKEIASAQEKIREYNKNYFSQEKGFETFNKVFNEMLKSEEYLSKETEKFQKLFEKDDRIENYVRQAKEEMLAQLSDTKDLTADSDWDKIFAAADKELDKLTPELEAAKEKFERAEKAQDNAYQKYLEDKFEKEFSPILVNYCDYVSKKAAEYTKPAINGKVNGHNVAIEQGSVMMRLDGSLVADVQSNLIWEKQKDAYLACINPSWDEEKLKSWKATITMKEMSDVKYGEYLLKYGFEEGKNLSSGEENKMGQTLALKNIGMFIIDPQRGLDYFYTLLGDYNQSKKLIDYLKHDWGKYGTTQTNWVQNEYGDMDNTDTYTLSSSSEEGDALKQTYTYRLMLYENTRNVLRAYFNELNELLIDIMYHLAQNPKAANNFTGYLNSIGISLTKDFLNIDDSLINQKLEEINQNLSREEKESVVEAKIQKRPFDPLMFALGPSHIVDRNRTLVRERRNAVQGFDLDNSQPIRDILFFNTLLQTNHRVYKANLEAWNELAYTAYEQKAMQLLASMASLGKTLNKNYEKEPQRYYNELEENLHEYGRDMVLDIGLGVLLGGITSIVNSIRSFVTSTAKVLIKNSIKVAFKSSFKHGIKAVSKRSLTLAKLGAKKSIKSMRQVLNGNFKSFNANALRKPVEMTTRGNINTFRTIKFKSPIRGTGRTLTSDNTVFKNTFRNIQSKHGIRPSAAKTSKMFNPELTKKQYQQLAQELNAYEKAAARAPEVKSIVGSAAGKTTPEQVAQIQQYFSRDLQGVKTTLFGARGGKAAVTVVPVPPGISDVLMGNANFKQLINRNPLTTRLFNKSIERTNQAIAQGLDLEEARAFFIKDFDWRLEMSPSIPKAHRQSIIEELANSLDMVYDGTMAKSNLRPGLHTENVAKTSAVEKTYTLGANSAKSATANMDTPVKKQGFFDRLKGMFGKEQTYTLGNDPVKTPTAKQNPMQVMEVVEDTPEVSQQIAKNTESVAQRDSKESLSDYFNLGKKTEPQVKSVSTESTTKTATANTSKKPAVQQVINKPEQPKPAVAKIENQSRVVSNSVSNTPAKSAVQTPKANTTKEFLLRHHFTEQDLSLLERTWGFKEGESLEKVKYLVEKGFTRDDIHGFIFNKGTFDNIDSLLKRGFSRDDIMALQRHAISVSGYSYEILDTLLKRGFSKEDIMYMLRNNIMSKDNIRIFENLIYKGFSRDNIITLGKNGALEGKKLSRLKNLIERGFSKDDIMQLEKDGFLNDKQFDKIESLMKDRSLSTKDIMDIEKSGKLKEETRAKSAILRDKGFSTEDIMTLQRQHANSQRHYEEIEYLLNKGFTRDDIMYLANRNALGKERNLLDMHDLIFRGFSRDDIMLLEKRGLFKENKIEKVKMLIEKGFKSDDIMQLEKDGFLDNNQIGKIESLIRKGWSPENIMAAEKRGKLSVKTTKSEAPIWKNNNFTSEERTFLNLISEDIGVDNTNFLVRKLKPNEISYLYKRHPGVMRNNFEKIKELLSEGRNVADVDAILSGKPTFSDSIRSMMH